MDYDQAYDADSDFFGNEPGAMLARLWPEIDRTRPVLDIGAGQGRHTLFLARHGLRVHALEPSRVGLDAIETAAAAEGLKVRPIHGDFETFEAEPETYGAILCYGLIQILPWTAVGNLVERLQGWITPGGVLFVTAWTTADPRVARHASTWKKVGLHSYENPEGGLRTYLEPGQILTLFAGFETLHHFEGLGPEHRHGGGPAERHGIVEAALRRP